MMPARELIKTLRAGTQGLDFTVRFLILDVCDRLERQIKDNELLVQRIAELRSRTVNTNADRIRAMSDEELAEFLESTHSNMAIKLGGEYIVRAKEYIGIWLKQPAEEVNDECSK